MPDANPSGHGFKSRPLGYLHDNATGGQVVKLQIKYKGTRDYEGGHTMTTNTNSYEEQTARLLAETKAELEAAEASKKEVDDKIAILTREAHAYELALQGYRRRSGRETTNEPDWGKLLEGLIHKEQLKVIAKHGGGKIAVSYAARLLYTKGFIKSRKPGNAYTIVQTLLSTMTEEGLFEKMAPGEFRLVGAQTILPE